MPKTTEFNLTGAQYHITFETPPPMPTTEQWFEHQAKRYLDANLGVQSEVDRLHDILAPDSGAVLCAFRTFRHEELNELMEHVVVNDQRGRNCLDFADLTNEPWVPKGPHILTDVCDGRHRQGIESYVNQANITKEGRRGFAAIHLALWGIYHGQDTVSETYHFLNGLASRYRYGIVPYLYLYGAPRLDSYWLVKVISRWGAPCAGGVVVPRS